MSRAPFAVDMAEVVEQARFAFDKVYRGVWVALDDDDDDMTKAEVEAAEQVALAGARRAGRRQAVLYVRLAASLGDDLSDDVRAAVDDVADRATRKAHDIVMSDDGDDL